MFSYKFYPNPQNFTLSRMVWMVTFCKSGFKWRLQRVLSALRKNRVKAIYIGITQTCNFEIGGKIKSIFILVNYFGTLLRVISPYETIQVKLPLIVNLCELTMQKASQTEGVTHTSKSCQPGLLSNGGWVPANQLDQVSLQSKASSLICVFWVDLVRKTKIFICIRSFKILNSNLKKVFIFYS